MPSSRKIGGSDESPEKKMVELQVVPVGDIEKNSTETVRGHQVTVVADGLLRGISNDNQVVPSRSSVEKWTC